MIARKNRYRIATSATGRAACRHCREPVPKGDACMIIDAWIKAGRRTKLLRCVSCITPTFAKAVLGVHVSARRIPVDAAVKGLVEDVERVRRLVGEAAAKA